jgi:hypothetical protein
MKNTGCTQKIFDNSDRKPAVYLKLIALLVKFIQAQIDIVLNESFTIELQHKNNALPCPELVMRMLANPKAKLGNTLLNLKPKFDKVHIHFIHNVY